MGAVVGGEGEMGTGLYEARGSPNVVLGGRLEVAESCRSEYASISRHVSTVATTPVGLDRQRRITWSPFDTSDRGVMECLPPRAASVYSSGSCIRLWVAGVLAQARRKWNRVF